MTERDGSKFEGMVLARLQGIEERMEETLRCLREVENRCLGEHASHAALEVELRAVREKANFNARVIWSAVAWITLTAAGSFVAFLRGAGKG